MDPKREAPPPTGGKAAQALRASGSEQSLSPLEEQLRGGLCQGLGEETG